MRTLWQLSRQARRQLPNIQCPLLGIHSLNDAAVPPVVLELMQQRIPVPIETAWFNHSGHVMLRDVSGADVARTLAEFFRRQL